MNHFNKKQDVLFYCYTLDVKQRAKLDAFLTLLEKSDVESLLNETSEESNIGRPEYESSRMIACILFGFAIGSSSLRELESSCKFDTRYHMRHFEGLSMKQLSRTAKKFFKNNAYYL